MEKSMKDKQFGRLTVVKEAGKTHDGRLLWLCCCSCGGSKVIRGASLRKSYKPTRSCGCLSYEAHVKHGMSETSEFRVWSRMKRRCLDPNYRAYRWYGALGVVVCEAWNNSFAAFLSDMGHRPSPQHTLDRIDPEGDYGPDNCRWATWKEQAANKRRTIRVTYQGETKALTEWSEKLGIKYATLGVRFRKGEAGDRLFRKVAQCA